MSNQENGRKIATGHARNGWISVFIRLDEETFSEVRDIAIKDKTSLTATLRQLVEEALLFRAGMEE
jgi:hypothetical protein